MVRHVIIWDLKDELDSDEKAAAAAKIKRDLEALGGVIDGLKEIKVYTELLSTSNGSLMLDSLFDDENALAYYADHPEHVKVKGYVGQMTKSRKCVDLIV